MLDQVNGEKIISTTPLGGGCIGSSCKAVTADGQAYFVKNYQTPGIAEAEATGLRELSQPNVKVPTVITYSDNQLILQFIDSSPEAKEFQVLLGHVLASLHKVKADTFGFDSDNFIGATPQKNQPRTNSWCEFYWQNRILAQVYLAENNGYADKSLRLKIGKLEDKIEIILSGSEEQPTLLHGDLWNGNYMPDVEGSPVLIDPAVYYGHRETDIAMTQLFGGFSNEFYESYNDTLALRAGWQSRMDFYKLYHLLNHLNLFGTSYHRQALDSITYYTG